ncbi:hypothetical protein HYH03_000670 [Edaphochlamys debaryana]|uniref:Uncharacterized protein n=1 Tax=Edaphochlamys debaryana TaxID=47281 RepID=A0A836C7E9_9CHLO|nr:hypothetical protein HYH03_000670 [Edaphochlamys debaryana]|eukprot:KAG2502183.1 hypothetical protein HYH03_000670 [Edaphochlamys debaryana]
MRRRVDAAAAPAGPTSEQQQPRLLPATAAREARGAKAGRPTQLGKALGLSLFSLLLPTLICTLPSLRGVPDPGPVPLQHVCLRGGCGARPGSCAAQKAEGLLLPGFPCGAHPLRQLLHVVTSRPRFYVLSRPWALDDWFALAWVALHATICAATAALLAAHAAGLLDPRPHPDTGRRPAQGPSPSGLRGVAQCARGLVHRGLAAAARALEAGWAAAHEPLLTMAAPYKCGLCELGAAAVWNARRGGAAVDAWRLTFGAGLATAHTSAPLAMAALGVLAVECHTVRPSYRYAALAAAAVASCGAYILFGGRMVGAGPYAPRTGLEGPGEGAVVGGESPLKGLAEARRVALPYLFEAPPGMPYEEAAAALRAAAAVAVRRALRPALEPAQPQAAAAATAAAGPGPGVSATSPWGVASSVQCLTLSGCVELTVLVSLALRGGAGEGEEGSGDTAQAAGSEGSGSPQGGQPTPSLPPEMQGLSAAITGAAERLGMTALVGVRQLAPADPDSAVRIQQAQDTLSHDPYVTPAVLPYSALLAGSARVRLCVPPQLLATLVEWCGGEVGASAGPGPGHSSEPAEGPEQRRLMVVATSGAEGAPSVTLPIAQVVWASEADASQSDAAEGAASPSEGLGSGEDCCLDVALPADLARALLPPSPATSSTSGGSWGSALAEGPWGPAAGTGAGAEAPLSAARSSLLLGLITLHLVGVSEPANPPDGEPASAGSGRAPADEGPGSGGEDGGAGSDDAGMHPSALWLGCARLLLAPEEPARELSRLWEDTVAEVAQQRRRAGAAAQGGEAGSGVRPPRVLAATPCFDADAAAANSLHFGPLLEDIAEVAAEPAHAVPAEGRGSGSLAAAVTSYLEQQGLPATAAWVQPQTAADMTAAAAASPAGIPAAIAAAAARPHGHRARRLVARCRRLLSLLLACFPRSWVGFADAEMEAAYQVRAIQSQAPGGWAPLVAFCGLGVAGILATKFRLARSGISQPFVKALAGMLWLVSPLTGLGLRLGLQRLAARPARRSGAGAEADRAGASGSGGGGACYVPVEHGGGVTAGSRALSSTAGALASRCDVLGSAGTGLLATLLGLLTYTCSRPCLDVRQDDPGFLFGILMSRAVFTPLAIQLLPRNQALASCGMAAVDLVHLHVLWGGEVPPVVLAAAAAGIAATNLLVSLITDTRRRRSFQAEAEAGQAAAQRAKAGQEAGCLVGKG